MNKNLLNLAFITFLSTSLFAQVGINTDSPSSTLDVSVKMNGTNLDNSQAYGLQAPRLSREELSNITATYGENQKGALVYITDISGGDIAGQRVNVTQVGYYYFDGLVWQKLSGSISIPGGIASAWNVEGTDNPATTVDGNIYHNGLIGINTKSPIRAIHITGDGGETDDILVRSNSASAGSAGQLNLSRSKGTATAPTTVANGDRVGDIVFSPYGSSYLDTASIRALVNGTVAAGSIPTDLLFLTGASTGTEKMRITSDGNVGIGYTSPSHKLDVNGTIRGGRITDGTNSITSGDFGLYNQNNTYLRITQISSAPIALYTDGASGNGYSGSTPTMVLRGNNVGIGTVASSNPGNKLEIVSGTNGSSGLRITNVKNANLLGTNANGDVIPVTMSTDIKHESLTATLNSGVTGYFNFANKFESGLVTVRTENGCGRTMVSSFIYYGASLAFLNGVARDKLANAVITTIPVSAVQNPSYTVTFPGVINCQAGGDETQFNFRIELTMDSNNKQGFFIRNNGNVTRKYTVSVLNTAL